MSVIDHRQDPVAATAAKPATPGLRAADAARGKDRARIPIATKLVLSYVVIIALALFASGLVATQLVGRLVISEAHTTIRNDLNAAREILLGKLNEINDVVRLTAERFFLREAIGTKNIWQAADELDRVRRTERLDFLSVTDSTGRVILRAGHRQVHGDFLKTDELLDAVRSNKVPAAAVSIMTAEELRRESPLLAERAFIQLIDTPRAIPKDAAEETAGMVLEAAAPIVDERGKLLGALYGGVLLNRNFEIVDRIRRTVFQDVKYKGRDVGTATIFLDDVRISTNVTTPDGARAVGTRCAADVYTQVFEGRPWVGRAFVVNDWYIAAYEPIRNLNGKIIGILYVGVLEQKYVDVRRRAVAALLALTLAGGLISLALSYHLSRRVSTSVDRLVTASKEMAAGNLDVTVEIKTNDELEDLAHAFNTMASALKQRDALLKEYARRKIMESERLAITGQLAAGVAHELNNPLQGIVAYSHLLLERLPEGNPMRASLQKIVNQADRCREIIRGLLNFSRPRTPQMKLSSVNAVVQECLALVERQALFHNITIVKNLRDDLPPVIMDPSQMQEVFMNIIINAAEAMDGVGRLVCTTRLDDSQNFVEIVFTDTGHGIRPEDLGKIFDPFFTTKDPGHGTGLGLAISRAIVENHKGTISVASEVGKGTTFTVCLPATTQGDA